MSNVYDIPVGYFRGRGAVTNTVSTTPYRSAGRPEAIFVIERLVDLAADRLGIDPAALRRRNMIPPAAQPYANPLGVTYDNGDYGQAMETALALADWDGFPARRAQARARGRYRGIGIANYVEITSGAPRERTEITVLPEGRVELVMGTMASGQGHETSFAQLVTEWLGVPFDSVDYVAHDTARVAAGGGSHSGRSMKLAATIIGKATDEIIDKGRKIASFLLETGEVDIEFEHGRFRRRRHRSRNRHLRGRRGGRDADGPAGGVAGAARRDFRPDPAGRELSLRHPGLRGRGRSRDRCGRDRRLRRGRRCRPGDQPDDPARPDPWRDRPGCRPGVARGMPLRPRRAGSCWPAALWITRCRAPLTLPLFTTALSEVPAPTNRLGVRSGGEGGTTPALAVVINAIVDALAEFGVRHVEMPATPERVWRAIQRGDAGVTVQPPETTSARRSAARRTARG